MSDKVFLDIVNMSITGSFAILIIILARLLLKKAPKVFSYALWFVAFFRLLVPVSFESVLSILPFNTTPLSTDMLYIETPYVETGIKAIDSVINPVVATEVFGSTANVYQIFTFWGKIIWFIGVFAFCLYSIRSYSRLKKKLQSAVLLRDNIYTATFARVQEELARRASKRKVKQTGTTTEQGKYCGKYALTELLICGECGTPYRRCTWTVGGKKRIVWRCINRLDYGKKYCHHSPTMEEAPLQNAIMDAVLKTAQIDPNILQTLKQHIRLGLGAGAGEDKSVEIQIRIAQIDQEFKSLLNSVTAENQQELLTDPRITDLMTEKRQLEKELAEYAAAEQHRQNTASRLDNIFTILDGMKNHPLTYDDAVIRQILQCVIVESKEKIKVVFIGGMEVKTEVEQ